MAQIKINVDYVAEEIVNEIKKAKELYVNSDPIEKTKWDNEKKVALPDGYRTEIQVMDKGLSIFRQTFLVKTMEKPNVAINDQVTLELLNSGFYFAKNEVIPWYSGEIKKMTSK